LFSATATDLLFDFGGADGVIFDNFNFGGFDGYCLDGSSAGLNCFGSPGSETVFFLSSGIFETVRATGVQVLATATAVPEPASWALFLAGFGLTGAALRIANGRRRMTKVSCAS
jgi:hypothetical protein